MEKDTQNVHPDVWHEIADLRGWLQDWPEVKGSGAAANNRRRSAVTHALDALEREAYRHDNRSDAKKLADAGFENLDQLLQAYESALVTRQQYDEMEQKLQTALFDLGDLTDRYKTCDYCTHQYRCAKEGHRDRTCWEYKGDTHGETYLDIACDLVRCGYVKLSRSFARELAPYRGCPRGSRGPRGIPSITGVLPTPASLLLDRLTSNGGNILRGVDDTYICINRWDYDDMVRMLRDLNSQQLSNWGKRRPEVLPNDPEG